MSLNVLQRPEWFGDGESADARRLRRLKCNGPREAVCRLLSHQFRCELRLEAAGQLLQSHVCRSQDEVLTTTESWKDAMLEKGWQ